MDMEKSNRSQWALISGLIVLIIPILFSLWTILQLGETLELRRKASNIRVHFDTLDQQITEWSGLVTSAKQDEKTLEKKHVLEIKIAQLFKSTEKEIFPDEIQLENHHKILHLWENLRTGKIEIESGTLEKIDNLVVEIDEHELANIAKHEPVIIKSTRQLVIGLTAIAIFAILIIFFALYAKRQEDERKSKMIQELIRLQGEALAASNLKSKFLATVSHEIRTPLNGIMGISDLLCHSMLTDRDKKYVGIIHQSGKTLLRIINDILDFSKIEAGKVELEKAPFAIADVVNQVALTLSTKANEKSIQLKCEIDPELPAQVSGDSDRLAQILFNLIGNAIKFTSSGSVTFAAKKVNENSIEFAVTDTGIGMTQEQLKNLFTPFYQGQKAGTSGEPGTGLGLSIAQHLVFAMGGSIEVASVLGKGSKFSFVLPFPEHSKNLIGESFKVTEASLQNLTLRVGKVLIAEDNPANQIVAQAMLQRLDLESTVVSNGQEALEMLENHSYDLILLDCQMPVLDGFEASRKIREMGIETPIVALTANLSAQNQEECKQAGMNGFLSKPLTVASLNEEIQKFLSNEKNDFSFQPLDKLAEKIGTEAVNKIIKAFIATLSDFETSSQDLTKMQRLGHRFKSSGELVGAFQFAELCRKLEESQDLATASGLVQQILSEAETVKSQLKHY